MNRLFFFFSRHVRRLAGPLAVMAATCTNSCIGEEYPKEDTPHDNFEALWRLMDEHYCFFDYKKEQTGVDWNEVHDRYARRISPSMTRLQLFEVLSGMLGELRDGHVNLGTAFDLGRNWSYRENYARNYDEALIETYLGQADDYHYASSLRYRILDDNTGYVRCASFEDGIGEGNLSYMFDMLKDCNGIIIDVRDNGGGSVEDAHKLASCFTNQRLLTGYTYHKQGKSHNDFSSPKAEHLNPSKGVRWQKPAVVLTNRSVFSAANEFVSCMKLMPQSIVLGDTTGGGSGMPFKQELPNGWTVRYSAVVFLDAQKQHTEFGVAPDTVVTLDSTDLARHRDTLIEQARRLIQSARKSEK